MDMTIPYNGKIDALGAFEKAKAVLDGGYLERFPFKIDFACDEQKREIVGKSHGATLVLSFEQTQCRVSLQLPFALKIFKKPILASLKEALEKKL